MSGLLLVWMISPLCLCVCVRICEHLWKHRSLYGSFSFFCRSRLSAEPACAYCCYPLYLRLSVVIGALSTSCYCDWSLLNGLWPNRWVYSECLDASFLYTRMPSNCCKHVHTQISLMWPSWQAYTHTNRQRDHNLLSEAESQIVRVIEKKYARLSVLWNTMSVWAHVLVCKHPCVPLYWHASIWCVRFVCMCLKGG